MVNFDGKQFQTQYLLVINQKRIIGNVLCRVGLFFLSLLNFRPHSPLIESRISLSLGASGSGMGHFDTLVKIHYGHELINCFSVNDVAIITQYNYNEYNISYLNTSTVVHLRI